MDRPAPKSDSSRIRPCAAAAGAPGDTGSGAKPRLTIPAILDKLDAVDDSRFRNRRSGDRVRFRLQNVPAKVTHPGGSSTERVVATRNLSPSGIGFLYGSFLHNGTRVVLTLKRRLGGEDQISGKVVYCAHVSGPFHQIGVRFDQKIFAKLYGDQPERRKQAGAAADSASAKSAATTTVGGRLLVIDAQAMDRALVAHRLRDTKLHVTAVADEQAALAAMKLASAPFDAVLCELDVHAAESVATVAALRAAGHVGPIFASAAVKVDAARIQSAAKIGVASVVSKPYERAGLIAAFSTRASPADAAQGAAGITDTAVRAVEQGIAEVKNLVNVCRSADAK